DRGRRAVRVAEPPADGAGTGDPDREAPGRPGGGARGGQRQSRLDTAARSTPGTAARTRAGHTPRRDNAGGDEAVPRTAEVTGAGAIEGTVVVNGKGETRIQRGHPWVFRSDVTRDR